MKVVNYCDAVKSIMAHDGGKDVRDSMKKAEELLNMSSPYELPEEKETRFIRVLNEEWKCESCGQRSAGKRIVWNYCPKCGAKVKK